MKFLDSFILPDPMKTIGLLIVLLIATAVGVVRSAAAAELKGTVRAKTGDTVTVALGGDLLPREGDKAEIYFKLAGTDDDISVATARVQKVAGDAVELKVENATGDVMKDQLVRITSANPQRRASLSATSPPTAQATVAAGTGLNPSFAFVDLNKVFKEHPKTKATEAEINAKKNEAKREYDEKSAAYQKLLNETNAAKGTEREAKIGEVKAMETEINGFRAAREKVLQDFASKARETLVAEIITMIKGMAGDVNLVIDSSGTSLNGVPLALFTPKQADMTANVSLGVGAARPGTPLSGLRNLQIAQVDMNRIFKSLNRTKNAEAMINGEKNAAKQEYDQRAAAYTKLQTSVSNMAAGKKRDDGIAKLQTMEKEIKAWSAAKEKELQEKTLKLRDGVVQAMGDAISAKMSGQQSALILDTSGMSRGNSPMFLFVSGIPDWSDEIIAQLNAAGGGKNAVAEAAASAKVKIACLSLERTLTTLPEGKQIQEELNAATQQARAEMATADAAKRQAKEAELQELNKQKFAPLIAKVQNEVAGIARKDGYNLVLNSSGHTLNGTPWIITSNQVVDLADRVLAALSSPPQPGNSPR